MPGYIHGLDPASKDDFFGIVVHELPETRNQRLCAINQLYHISFDKIYSYVVNDQFNRYPPHYVVIDYSNEKTFSDLLVRLYGKDKIELVSFTNSNKQMLKEDGLSIMKQDYKFPNPESLKDPTVAKYVKDLVIQLGADTHYKDRQHDL